MESYLAQKDMVELLKWKTDIPKDTKGYTKNEEKETDEVKSELKIQYQN
jgi:hypothetical protein